jgi:NAD+ kinase
MRVGFILRPDKTEASELAARLSKWLAGAGHEPIVLAEDNVAIPEATVIPEAELGSASDIAVVLGGDGTMLRAANLVSDDGVPVVGVNLGRLGFLTPFAISDARDALEDALAGRLETSQRMRIEVTYVPGDGSPMVRHALNDAVIHQGAMARLIELEAEVEGELISAYRADGLIVATPTGSTAYNLAAGGPILLPQQSAMALTPICAHSLTNRPLVIPSQSTITVRLGGDSRGVVLTVDGQWAHSFLPGDRVEIRVAESSLILFDSDRGYFGILRDKLHWGARADARISKPEMAAVQVPGPDDPEPEPS